MFPFWADDSWVSLLQLAAAAAASLLWMLGIFGGRPAAG
jgi:hypothetical protein